MTGLGKVAALALALAGLPAPAPAPAAPPTEPAVAVIFAGYQAAIDGPTRTTSTIVVSKAQCTQDGTFTVGAVVAQTGATAFVGVSVQSTCSDGEEHYTGALEIQGGGPITEPIVPGDRIRVRITTDESSSAVWIKDLDQGWTIRAEGPAVSVDQSAAWASLGAVGSSGAATFRDNRIGRTPLGQAGAEPFVEGDPCGAVTALRRHLHFRALAEDCR